MGGRDNGRTGARGRRQGPPGQRAAPPPDWTVALEHYGHPAGDETALGAGTRPYDAGGWTEPGSNGWPEPGVDPWPPPEGRTVPLPDPHAWTGSATVPQEPETWTGAAAVPGQWVSGGTRPYAVDPEPGPPRGYRSLPAPQMPSRRRFSLATIFLIGLAAVVLFVVAGLPVLHRLGLGRVPTTPAAAPAATPAMSAGTATATAQTIAVEAESPDNTVSGSAFIGAYQGASGGRLVRAIGTWGGTKGPGSLQFNNVTVATTGTYVVTFYFVNIQGQATRTAVITTTDGDSATVTVTGNNSTCCDSKRVELQLNQGSNNITFSNPNGEAPAIDRITVSAQ